MATLRPNEERDSKGNTIRMSPSITYTQDRQIRKIRGRSDYDFIDNDRYHEPITAQVQNGKIVFFYGTPHNSESRRAAKEITMAEVERVAPYIIADLRRNPMKVREPRPVVYEVKLAVLGDEAGEGVVTSEIPNDGRSVTITAIEPDLRVKRGGAPAQDDEAASLVAAG
jgi:hypothetical protein